MPEEYIFDVAGASKSEIVDQLIEAEGHIPGLVFSYPPISSWRPVGEEDGAPERLWTDADTFSHNLYVHIPFCRQKCSFCYYSVAVVANDSVVLWDYLRCLEKEAASYREQLGDKQIETVFIGGGTPSRLDVAQIGFLFERVVRQFDLSACREITYECSPDSITPDKLAEMARQGVTRLSMGVQSLDPEILRRSRRGDDPSEVIDAYYAMVASGIPNINIDLIAGIEREAFDNIERTMDGVAALDVIPTQVTLFTLSVRRGAVNKKTLGAAEPISLFRRSLALYRYAKRRLEELGHWQFSRNLFPRENWLFHYQDNHWGGNGYVLALGASGYSHSHSHTYLNAFNYREYMRRVEAGVPAVEKAFALSPDESLRRHVALAMKHTELDRRRFASFYPHGSDPLGDFEGVFAALEALGVVTVDEERIRYTPEYADLSDRFVRLFYSEEVNALLRGEVALPTVSSQNAFSFTV